MELTSQMSLDLSLTENGERYLASLGATYTRNASESARVQTKEHQEGVSPLQERHQQSLLTNHLLSTIMEELDVHLVLGEERTQVAVVEDAIDWNLLDAGYYY
jgi:hypothetical protein